MAGFFLRFPKMVEVRNPRLTILYCFLQACTVGLLLWWFISQQFWDKEVDIGSYINAGIYVSERGLRGTGFRQRVQELNRTLCQNVGTIEEFWTTADGERQFGNWTCSLPCLPGQVPNAGDCTVHQDSFLAKSDREIFIPTTRLTRIVTPRQPPVRQQLFMLTPDMLQVSLSYFYDIPTHKPNGGLAEKRIKGSSEFQVATNVITASGGITNVGAGEPLTFTLQELLNLAGQPDVLDEIHEQSGVNARPGSSPVGPLGRVSGIELLISVRCSGDVGSLSASLDTCEMRVSKSERGWSWERILDYFQGDRTNSVDYTGIRIRVLGEGVATYFDTGTLISRLTICFVILTVPRKLVMLMCTFLLGHLSTIYREAIYEKFQIRDTLAGMAARLLVWNTAFVDLVDKDVADGNCGISKQRIRERLTALLKNRSTELDSGEINHLCEFCYSALFQLTNLKKDEGLTQVLTTQLQDITDEVMSTGTGEVQDDSKVIDSDMFSVACTSAENLNFDAVVKLFDVQRRRPLLERIFTPKELAADLKETKEKVDLMSSEEPISEESSLDRGEGAEQAENDEVPAGDIASLTCAVQKVRTQKSEKAPRPSQQPSIVDKDPMSAFTLEEERELRKNLHKKVAQLLDEKAKIYATCEQIRKTVDDHRHHFDTRHREHYSKVLSQSDETHRKIDEFARTLSQKTERLEESLRMRVERMESLLGTATQAEAKSTQGEDIAVRPVVQRPHHVKHATEPLPPPIQATFVETSQAKQATEPPPLPVQAAIAETSQAEFQAGDSRGSSAEAAALAPLPAPAPQAAAATAVAAPEERATSLAKAAAEAPATEAPPPTAGPVASLPKASYSAFNKQVSSNGGAGTDVPEAHTPWKTLFMATLTRPTRNN